MTTDAVVVRSAAVLVAAGGGTRLGTDRPKALVELGGRPLVAHALAGLAAAGLPVVVVHPPAHADAFRLAAGDLPVFAFVAGGSSRTDSVRRGLAALAPDVEVVAIHDAARPLTPVAVITATLRAVVDDPRVLAAAPAQAVTDTLKRTAGDDVVGTVDRAEVVGVQTPQVFRRAVIDRALATGDDATDDLALVERLIAEGRVQGRVVVVPGSPWSHKVTYPHDLALVEALALVRPPEVAS
jgi:2-C-methyl-D-erythritol 4-phosphate cytidylyltransferase